MTREQFISHVEDSEKGFRRFLTALCCGDSTLADDIAQETYIKAYLSCGSFNNPDKFNAWIFKIGYNTFLNHHRTTRVFTGYDMASDVAANERADANFKYQALYIALDKLHDKERTSILLYYMQGYSIREIADIVGASQDAVKQHLSRGRNHLKSLLST